MARLVQLQNSTERRVALVGEPRLELLNARSVYELVSGCLVDGVSVLERIDVSRSGVHLDYDPIYEGRSDWKILPPIDHSDPAHCILSGTGLTHLGSAKNRNAMHEKKTATADETDSMKMFRWGIEQGKPSQENIGIAPEWFYKGTGVNLRGHNQALEVPAYAEDGGEEAEIAGVYLIDPRGQPVRMGMTQGNEFSDHVFERKNYLNLAGSKLRTCAIGPELVVGEGAFQSVSGEAAILRGGKILWSQEMVSGEGEMSHSLANIEHHHFKFENHRRPGDVHIHFFGTSALSYAQGIRIEQDDVMQVHFAGFGRPLRNSLRVDRSAPAMVRVQALK